MSSNDVSFADEQQGKEALLDVRSDATSSDWCLFTYENPKSTKLVLVGKGSGGINELVENLRDDIVGYGLVRKADKIDDSVTIKFAFIFFTGENINRMLRAKLGVHSGSVKKLIGQYHVDIAADKKEELSESILTEKITLTSGSGSRVVDKETGARQGASSSSGSRERTATSGAKSGELKFVDEASLKDAISSVRANAGGLDWVLFTYEGGNSNNIVLLGTGSGGVSELLDNLKDDIVGYRLVRKIEKIDESETVKFAYIRFIGENIPRMLRARLGTHTGAVNTFFHPYHVTLEVSQKNELSDDIVMNAITTASGTKVHVLSESEAASKGVKSGGSSYTPAKSNYVPASKSSAVPGIPKQQGQDQSNVKFANEEDIKNDIKDVRSDATEINWALVGYEGGKGNVLVSLGKGSGGLDELLENLQDNIVAYGLLRETEKIDESLTVKFVHIVWVGDNIDRMHRAKIGTHKGAIQSLFTPYHCDVSATQKSELTHEIIRQRIQDVSGTATKVKNI